MLHRQMFICSAIEKCRETVNCCPHKQPHIKDERCVPRECRYAPGAENIDCDPFDPAHPRTPVPVPVAPVKTVEQKMKETKTATEAHIEQANVRLNEHKKTETIEPQSEEERVALYNELVASGLSDAEARGTAWPEKENTQKERDIKEAVKKASQKSAKAPKKTQGRKKGE